MADDNRWNDRERDWRDDRGRGPRGGDFGRGGQGNRGYEAGGSADERWRQMHQDRRYEGPAGYNDSGPVQGGWEFGDEAQGGERGQGYQRYGYGRGQQDRPDEYRPTRQYGRGQYGQSGPQRWRSESQTAYGAHTPYGYRGRNEFDDRGRGGDYADTRPDGEGRSWLERAGERVSAFFGADDTGSHRGRGPKGYRRSDDRIREDINDRLTDDAWLDASDIEVVVRETEVTLSGAVNSREDKRRAEDIAESVSGVRNVLNNLRVEGQDAQTTGRTIGTTTSSTVQDVASGKDQKNLGTGRQASTD
jgi:osmotically-inducible protein OsmY